MGLLRSVIMDAAIVFRWNFCVAACMATTICR
jgi:hypothetical protein